VLTGIIYGWLLLNLILLIIPSRKPLHDRMARTIVVRARIDQPTKAAAKIARHRRLSERARPTAGSRYTGRSPC
jgi:uncharacterized RDD family membrane protein YckC